MPTNDVTLEPLIYRLIDVNKANLDRFVDLLSMTETNITNPDTAPNVAGELASLIREIVLAAIDSISQVLGIAEALQTSIVNRLFPPA